MVDETEDDAIEQQESMRLDAPQSVSQAAAPAATPLTGFQFGQAVSSPARSAFQGVSRLGVWNPNTPPKFASSLAEARKGAAESPSTPKAQGKVRSVDEASYHSFWSHHFGTRTLNLSTLALSSFLTQASRLRPPVFGRPPSLTPRRACRSSCRSNQPRHPREGWRRLQVFLTRGRPRPLPILRCPKCLTSRIRNRASLLSLHRQGLLALPPPMGRPCSRP